MLTIVRETLIIGAVVLVLVFPAASVNWLLDHGVSNVVIAGMEIKLDQFQKTTALLNTAEQLKLISGSEPQALTELKRLAVSLTQTAVEQVRGIAAVSPGLLPQAGWLYLGTVKADKSSWQPKMMHDIDEQSPPAVGDVVTLSTDVNLRVSSARPDPQGTIISVLPSGTRVRVRSLDTSRVVPPGDAAAPGFRAWATIEVVS